MAVTRFSILGDGAWGTAIALHLAKVPEAEVRLWSARADNFAILKTYRENRRLLPGVPIPAAIQLTNDPAEAVRQADLWITAIPTVYLRSTIAPFRGLLPAGVPIVSLTKGIEVETFRRPTEILAEVLGAQRLAVLSGPSHAEEVSRGLPTSVVVASEESALAEQLQRWFASERFRVYTNFDPLGVELAGALKNVIGIAAGICDGLGFGDNAKSALLTRGLVEMTRFGVALGAEASTFQGLAGLGDLITTCISPHGRNRRLGEWLGKGRKWTDWLAESPMVVEGVTTAQSVHERATRMGVEMPIMQRVYEVLYEDKPPLDAVRDLMLRQPRSERTFR